jgi:hypothetical protein
MLLATLHLPPEFKKRRCQLQGWPTEVLQELSTLRIWISQIDLQEHQNDLWSLLINCCLYFNFDYDVIELIQHPINLMRTCWGGSCNIVPEAIRLCHGKLIILSGQHPKSCQRYYLVKTGWWFGKKIIIMVNTWVITIVNDGWWWLIVFNYTGWWWLEPWNLRNFHILGMSWSQLTFICFRGVGIPPTRKYWTN